MISLFYRHLKQLQFHSRSTVNAPLLDRIEFTTVTYLSSAEEPVLSGFLLNEIKRMKYEKNSRYSQRVVSDKETERPCQTRTPCFPGDLSVTQCISPFYLPFVQMFHVCPSLLPLCDPPPPAPPPLTRPLRRDGHVHVTTTCGRGSAYHRHDLFSHGRICCTDKC